MQDLKVLFVSAEVVPFAKTGGLADVAGSLPQALKKIGVDIRVAMPNYSIIDPKYNKKKQKVCQYEVEIGQNKKKTEVFLYEEEVPTYFIHNAFYFDRDQLYGYEDDDERFAFFCKSVLEMLPCLQWKPDIIHCNDWHSGPICILLKEKYSYHPFYRKIATVYTIHNLQYQGVFPKTSLSLLGLSTIYDHPDGIEFYGNINYMKAGLFYSHALTTVSPTYAKEIQTPAYGHQLDGVLQKQSHRLHGILNGLDYKKYNPKIDPNLYTNYDIHSLKGKKENKRKLQQALGLPILEVPMIGLITRLADQKGLDLIQQRGEILLQNDIQLVILGTGEKKYEDFFQKLEYDFPQKVSTNLFFDESLAHKIYAGSDMFLMPSRFEPCGLGQMISLCYGTIPIVRETGGLADTIQPFDRNTETGNGFVFRQYHPDAMKEAMEQALETYLKYPNKWEKIIYNAMSSNYSWEQSARQYVELYCGL